MLEFFLFEKWFSKDGEIWFPSSGDRLAVVYLPSWQATVLVLQPKNIRFVEIYTPQKRGPNGARWAPTIFINGVMEPLEMAF